MVQDFLEPMIGSGADREKYEELVDHTPSSRSWTCGTRPTRSTTLLTRTTQQHVLCGIVQPTRRGRTGEPGVGDEEAEEAAVSEVGKKKGGKKGQERQGRKGGRKE